MNRLWGEAAPALGVGAAVCALVLGYAALTERASRAHLDTLVGEIGEAVAETAATSIRATDAVLARLDEELARSMRLKATFLEARAAGSTRLLDRFAVATGLRRVLLLDARGALLAEGRDVPRHDPAEAAFLAEARALVRGAGDEPRLKEAPIPGAGRAPWIVYAAPLGPDRWAVLFQNGSVFARARQLAGPDAVSARLERETSIAFVRFNAPVPEAGPATRVFRRDVERPKGTLAVGLDTSSVGRSLAVQRKAATLYALVAGIGTALAVWLLRRLRRSRETLARRVEHEQRLAGLGRLAANIAHEVRNPLNAIGIAAQRIERRDDLGPDARRLARVVSDEVTRLDRTVTEVLRHARPAPPRLAPVDLPALVGTVAELARAEAEQRKVTIEVEGDGSRSIVGDADLLRGALWNLLRNAIGVSPAGATVVLRAVRDNGELRLEVADEGPGLPPNADDALFEPFVTERPGGSGLGLSLALAAAQAHGGTMDANSRAGGGSVFRIRLPQKGLTR